MRLFLETLRDLLNEAIQALLLIFVLVYVGVPLLFAIHPPWILHTFFLNYVRFPYANYDDLAKYGIRSLGRNFYIRRDDTSPSLGVWHILPDSFDKKFEGYTPSAAQMEEALKNSVGWLALYFPGNCFDRTVKHRCQLHNLLASLGIHVLALDYRGYGDSTQIQPTEDGITEDVRTLYDYARGVAPQMKIAVWGHSMGSGVALALSENLRETGSRGFDALILEAPFNNLYDAVYHHPFSYPWRVLPIFDQIYMAPLIASGTRMNSDERIADVECPILIVHAEDDEIIPVELGQKLREAGERAARRITYKSFPEERQYGHKFIFAAPELPGIVHRFLFGDEQGGE